MDGVSMDAIRLDVSGKFAHFRMPYSMNPLLTYPFPTKTSIIGMAGALMGKGRNEYYGLFEESKVAVVVRNRTRKKMLGIKYIKEKRSGGKYMKYGLIEDWTPRSIEVLLDPRFTIYIMPAERFGDVSKRKYTPSLGKSEFVANVEISRVEMERKRSGEVDSVVPLGSAVPLLGEGVEVVKVPSRVDSERTIVEWTSVCHLIDGRGKIVLRDETDVFSDGEFDVMFF